MHGPLNGLVVVEASWGLPTSLAGMMLADYGARVVKVERSANEFDPAPTLRAVAERGKWSVALDLCDPADAETFENLVAGADVLLTSARVAPGGIVDIDGVRSRHHRLVHCHVSGYGLDGPFTGRPGYDQLVAARLGLMVEQSGHRAGPKFLGHPSIDYVTAFLAASGILAALHARDRTGEGQLVDTSLLDGALTVSSMNWWYNERDLSYLARSGTETGFGRNRIITDMFSCADGEYLMIHTGGNGGFKRTMDLLGLGGGVREIGGLEMSVPLDDEEYHAARHLVPQAFRARSREEWISVFHSADLAALPVLRPEQVFEDDQVLHAEVAVELTDPGVGRIRQIGPVVRFASSGVPGVSPAPVAGADSVRVAELATGNVGAESAPRSARNSIGSPLEGLRVLDFSGFFATAFGARLLSDLGADVIKVEPTRGDQMRPLADLFECAQRGKRNLALDMRSPAGVEVVKRLLATSDVVMHNLRPGKAEKLGIGYEQCRQVNPKVIYCYLPGFGSTGPKANLKSFAPLVSGFTGMLYIGAGAGNPPVRRVIGNEDLYNGLLGAYAVLMAITYRDRTGSGQYVESPHLHSSLMMRSEHCTDEQLRPISGLLLDSEQFGWGPLYRLYRTSDGWLALACVGQKSFEKLLSALRMGALAADPRLATAAGRSANPELLTSPLEQRFAGMSAETAFRLLDEAGVACEIPADSPTMADFLWDEWAERTQRVFAHVHPEHGYVREVGHGMRLSGTPLAYKGTSARLGQHTRELLDELGYSCSEVNLLLDGVCSEPASGLDIQSTPPNATSAVTRQKGTP